MKAFFDERNHYLFKLVLKSPNGEWPITYTFTFTFMLRDAFRPIVYEQKCLMDCSKHNLLILFTFNILPKISFYCSKFKQTHPLPLKWYLQNHSRHLNFVTWLYSALSVITGSSKCEIQFFLMTVIKKLKFMVKSMTGVVSRWLNLLFRRLSFLA